MGRGQKERDFGTISDRMTAALDLGISKISNKRRISYFEKTS